MGLVDAFGKEDRVEVKFNDFYTMMKGCTQRDMLMNAINCDVPHKYMREMVTGEREEAQKKLKQIKELKQQLATKDKALDKACGKLEYEYTHSDRGRCPNVDYGFIPKCCNKDFCNDSNNECWKEWAENETTD